MFLRCLLITLVTAAFLKRMQATEMDSQETDGRVSVCPEDGVYPNYYNCSTFITCSNGIQYLMACPEGLIWNVDTSECDWPNNTECVTYPAIRIDYWVVERLFREIFCFRRLNTFSMQYHSIFYLIYSIIIFNPINGIRCD
ncbi:putative peritrophic matrix protein PTM2 [Daphnia pulex]|uniref:Putative peritrophic matrix protein PTM2 n=1 Tax=Daphnia pulex TaxID=6669 RepID=E9H3D2_DAPPU|nr:putative peritrophic matrix protein PTM2 [Daphnia pulex]|eukprot:EFX73742.1 putative peritrophic matrix protein PTM2 [Daphnia pulex]